MKARRFSIAKAMALTALMAVDLAWLRVILFGSGSVVGIDAALNLANGFLFDFGLFGMFHLLALGLFRLASCAGNPWWFLVGFEVFGLLAMFVYWGCCCEWGAWFLPEPRGSRGWGLFPVGETTNVTLRAVGVDMKAVFARLGCNPVVCLVDTAVLTFPQWLVAVIGGLLVRLAANRGRSEISEQGKALPVPAVDGSDA